MPSGGAVWRPYTQMKTAARPPEVIRTDGVRLYLADGRTLIDGIASWWTACHGYNHPHIAQAVRHQLERMPHVMFGGLTHAPAEHLAERLAALLPGDLDHVFFSESGSVAVEIALKMAVQYWLACGEERRTRFVSFRAGYHGDTLGAMSVTDPDEGMHRRLGAYVPRGFVAELPDTAERLAALDHLLCAERAGIAAIIVEPLVQGAGGMRFHAAATVRAIADCAARHWHLLILDEILTGFGRTGTLFAAVQAGIVPDIICLSKALTGGTLPLAATVAGNRVYEAFLSDDPAEALMHGPTFMANPLACAAANASLDLFETEPRLTQVARIAELLAQGLAPARALPRVADVRVMGAVGVVQLRDRPDSAALRAAALARGVWLRPFGDVIYLTPPFVISDDDLAILCDAVIEIIAALSRAGTRSREIPGSSSYP